MKIEVFVTYERVELGGGVILKIEVFVTYERVTKHILKKFDI